MEEWIREYRKRHEKLVERKREEEEKRGGEKGLRRKQREDTESVRNGK